MLCFRRREPRVQTWSKLVTLRRRPPESVREAVVILSEHGHSADVDLSGRHYKVVWTANGRKYVLVVSRTPSDCRARDKSRAMLRRLLREEITAGPAINHTLRCGEQISSNGSGTANDRR